MLAIKQRNYPSNLNYEKRQARWLAESIAGHVTLPEPDIMLRDIEEMKIWKRSWMHFSPTRSSRLFLHPQHYHDESLKDFGVNPLRKQGLLAPPKELFSPYMPIDYSAIVSGEFERFK